MNENANSNGFRFWLYRRKFLWLAILPLAAMLVVAVYWGIQEWKASQSIQLQFSEWEKAGVPYSNATLHESYERRTHIEGYADWDRVCALVDWGSGADFYNQLPYMGYEGEAPTVLIPGEDSTDGSTQWADEELVASYFDEMQPAIDLIEQASTHPTPVRFPIEFEGFSTPLPHMQKSRQVIRVLSLDFDYAYSQQETARALRDLSLMQSTAEAFDNRECLVTMLANFSLRGIRHTNIRRTLTHSIWDDADLFALRESLSVRDDFPARCREAIIGERAFALAFINKSLDELVDDYGLINDYAWSKSLMPIMPSDKQTLIEIYDELIQLPVGSVQVWRMRSDALRDKLNDTLPANSVVSMILPATGSALEAGIRVEDSRRWTLTAVALRQYEQQHGDWPERLSDLESLGLEIEDYSDCQQEKFGYEVDGDSAFLWRRSVRERETQISLTRPIPNDDEDHLLELRSRSASRSASQ